MQLTKQTNATIIIWQSVTMYPDILLSFSFLSVEDDEGYLVSGQTRSIYWAVMWESSNTVIHFELLLSWAQLILPQQTRCPQFFHFPPKYMRLTQFQSIKDWHNSKCRTALVWNCQCNPPASRGFQFEIQLTNSPAFGSKLIRDSYGWVYAKKVYFHQYKSQNIETLIARITENTEIYLAVVVLVRCVQCELDS